LVGRVIATAVTRSTVLLLNDPTSGVGVRVQRSGVTGIAEGQTGRDTLALAFVDANADVNNGDLVITSGLQNGRFPAGIPVGTVADLTRRPGDLDLDARIAPSVNLRTLDFVKVLKYEAPPQ
jgi:rod shape-determining protein MreC